VPKTRPADARYDVGTRSDCPRGSEIVATTSPPRSFRDDFEHAATKKMAMPFARYRAERWRNRRTSV
jgi:hypothetical protein